MTSPFDPVVWTLAHGRALTLGPRGVLMAIINVTPDSFSDGGRNLRAGDAIDNALRAIDEGAVIIDIGGESTRPGAAEVSADEEQARVLPVIEALAGRSDIVLSIDTYRASTAERAIAAGAHIVNDVHGLQRDPDIAGVVAASGAGVCIMHTGRGRQKRPTSSRTSLNSCVARWIAPGQPASATTRLCSIPVSDSTRRRRRKTSSCWRVSVNCMRSGFRFCGDVAQAFPRRRHRPRCGRPRCGNGGNDRTSSASGRGCIFASTMSQSTGMHWQSPMLSSQ